MKKIPHTLPPIDLKRPERTGARMRRGFFRSLVLGGLALSAGLALSSCSSRQSQADAAAVARLRQMGLIECEEDVNKKQLEDGSTLLINAAEKGDVALVQTLLAAGASPDGRGYPVRSTPLTRAQNVDVVKALLQAGADVKAVDAVGTTPLSWAACMGDAEGAKLLLEHGAAVKPDPPADPPLLNVSKVGLARLLLDAGADVNQPSRFGVTPLMYAAACGNAELAGFYLDAGADVRAKDGKGNTALHFSRSPRLVRLLCKAGADVAALNGAGETPLFDILHNARTVKAMIEEGVPVDIVSSESHMTALQLMLGDRREDDAAILALIRAGAGVAGTTPEGATALHQAVSRPYSRKRVEIVKALLKAGADPSLKDSSGRIPLQCLDQQAADAAELRSLLSAP